MQINRGIKMKNIIFFVSILLFLLAGCESSSGSSEDELPPNKITGPASPVYIETTDSNRDVNLIIEGAAVPGLVYKYTVEPVGSGSTIELPAEIDLGGFSSDGIITVTYNAAYSGKYVTIGFWTEKDDESSTPYSIIFFFRIT